MAKAGGGSPPCAAIVGNKSTTTAYQTPDRFALQRLPALPGCRSQSSVFSAELNPRPFLRVICIHSISSIKIKGCVDAIEIARESGYFDTHTELKPLFHTWSCWPCRGVQYYILFPLFLLLAWPLGKRWHRRDAHSLCRCSVWALHTGVTYNKPAATFYLLPTRGWEILLGCFVAINFQRISEWKIPSALRQSLTLLGLLLIAFAIFAFSERTPFPSLYALVPTLGVVLVIAFTNERTLVHRILSVRLLTGLGLISYSAYLWHQPLLAFGKYKSLYDPSMGLMAFLSALSVPLAYLSWKFVERPFRNRVYIARRTVFASSAVLSGCFIAFGLSGVVNDGYSGRIEFPPNIKWMSLSAKINANGDVCEPEMVDGFEGINVCFFGDISSDKSIALYGDSHAEAISEQLDIALKAKGFKGINVDLDGCEVVPRIVEEKSYRASSFGKCTSQFENLKSYLSRNTQAIVVASRWTTRLYPVSGAIEDLQFNNGVGGIEKFVRYREYVALNPDQTYAFDGAAKKEALRHLLLGLAEVNKVMLVYPVPEVGWDIFRTNLEYYADTGTALDELSFPKSTYLERNRFVLDVFDEVVGEDQQFVPIRTESAFCDDIVADRCVAQYQTIPLYYDDHHVSDEGARLIVEPLIEALEAGLPQTH